MKRKLLASLLMVLGASSANAGVVGSSWLEISNLLLFEATANGPVVVTTDMVTIQSDNRNSTLSAAWNSPVISVGGVATSGSTLDLAPLCTGPSCGLLPYTGNNDSTTSLTSDGGRNYSYSDMYISGSAIGLGAAGLTRADSSGTPESVGSANSEITNNILAVLTFTLSSTKDLFFGYAYEGWASAVISDDLLGKGSSADASTNFSIKVGSQTVENLSVAASAFDVAGFNSELNPISGFGTSDVLTLGPGTYSVQFTQKSSANINAVPEPASLALAGLGLLGLGALRRRRSA